MNRRGKSTNKVKLRKTRERLEKERRITYVMKALCWLAAFCVVVSLIKIASVLAAKGNDTNYASDLSHDYIRGAIVVHALLALIAILARRWFTMIAAIILTSVMFVATFTLPVYADFSECLTSEVEQCQHALIYHEKNIYDF